ncbi:hypothetical protein V491_05477, partial [Pseudogymnoascus sp. VKM F-3775]
MSSANPGASGDGPPEIFDAQGRRRRYFNPPDFFANFNFESDLGFSYTEASFQRQLAVRDTKAEKYNQKEAFPRPDGIEHDLWKKCFNSADSWVYNQFSQSKAVSLDHRRYRHSTRRKAEEKLLERLTAAGRTVPGPD